MGDAAVDCSACATGYTLSVAAAAGTLSTCAASACDGFIAAGGADNDVYTSSCSASGVASGSDCTLSCSKEGFFGTKTIACTLGTFATTVAPTCAAVAACDSTGGSASCAATTDAPATNMAAITTPADTNCAGSPCAATDHAVCCTASAGYNIPADGTAVLNVCTAKADAAAWTALGCTTTTATATGVAGLGTVTAATGYTSCAITSPTNAAAFVVVAVKKPAAEPEPATPSAGPDQVVVLTQTLAMTGVTAAEVCTDEGKKLILEAVAEALKVKVEQLLVSKCADTTGRRRS